MFFNILHINYLLGFRKMTFTIHLIFTSLAGMKLRPLFTTFCSCLVIIFLEKKITALHVKHMILHLMFYEFLSHHYMENLFYLSLTHLQFGYRHAWVLVFRKMSFLIHLNFAPLTGIISWSFFDETALHEYVYLC